MPELSTKRVEPEIVITKGASRILVGNDEILKITLRNGTTQLVRASKAEVLGEAGIGEEVQKVFRNPPEERGDVVSRAMGHEGEFEGKEGRWKQTLKTFKLESDSVTLELRRDDISSGWWVSATVETTSNGRGGGRGSEYFKGYTDAVDYFNSIAEKYGIVGPIGSDYGSD